MIASSLACSPPLSAFIIHDSPFYLRGMFLFIGSVFPYHGPLEFSLALLCD